MKERPILFSAPMIRALLDGTKKQTRRKAKVPADACDVRYWSPPGGKAKPGWADPGLNYWTPDASGATLSNHLDVCPYGEPRDRLWVRETWQGPLVEGALYEQHGGNMELFRKPEFCLYAADGGPRPEFMDADDNLRQRWTPGIHMFRWASRITLDVTEIRVERLQDISHGDAMDEGCPFPNMAQGPDPRQWYRELWDSINGDGAWAANPWVWCVSFRKRTPTIETAVDAAQRFLRRQL